MITIFPSSIPLQSLSIGSESEGVLEKRLEALFCLGAQREIEHQISRVTLKLDCYIKNFTNNCGSWKGEVVDVYTLSALVFELEYLRNALTQLEAELESKQDALEYTSIEELKKKLAGDND